MRHFVPFLLNETGRGNCYEMELDLNSNEKSDPLFRSVLKWDDTFGCVYIWMLPGCNIILVVYQTLNKDDMTPKEHSDGNPNVIKDAQFYFNLG